MGNEIGLTNFDKNMLNTSINWMGEGIKLISQECKDDLNGHDWDASNTYCMNCGWTKRDVDLVGISEYSESDYNWDWATMILGRGEDDKCLNPSETKN